MAEATKTDDKAKAATGSETIPNFADLKTVEEHVPSENIWPDLPQKKMPDLAGVVYEESKRRAGASFGLLEAVKRSKNMGENKDGEAEISDFFVARCVTADGEPFTCILGGTVIYPKVEALLAKKALPVKFTVCKPGRYYDIQ